MVIVKILKRRSGIFIKKELKRQQTKVNYILKYGAVVNFETRMKKDLMNIFGIENLANIAKNSTLFYLRIIIKIMI